MAIKNIVETEIKVTGQTTVQQAAVAYEDLGDAVSKTQLEAERLAQQFGINDARTQEAIKVAGRYKNEMEQLDFAIEAAKGGSDQLFRAAQGVTAGFELAAGATALFGSESEELQKILVRVQGAMAFSQGLKDIKEFAPAIRNVANATKEWWVSLSLIEKTFVTLGIGLLVDLIFQLSSEFKKLYSNVILTDDALKNAADSISDSVMNIDKLTNAVKNEALSENERLNALRELQNLYPNYFQNIGDDINDTNKLQIAKDKLVNSLIHEAKIRAIQDEISNTYKDTLSDEIELTEKINKFREASNKNTEELNKKLKDGKITQQSYNVGINQANILRLKAIDLEGKLLQIQSKREDRIKTLNKMITDSTQIILNNGGATQKSTEAVTKNNQALIESNNQTEKIAKNQNELKSQTLTNIQETTQATIDSTNITLSFIEERQKTALERAKLFIGAFGEDIKNTFQDTLSAVGALASAFAGEDEERQRKAFDLNKKLAIVQTTISTIEATVNAFKKAQENPLNEATAGAYAFTRAAIAAAFGVAQIAQIQSQKFGSYTQPSVQGQAGGGSFGASLNAPAVRLPRTEQFTGDRRVYVTEYDISNTQEKVKVTEDVSIVK